MKQLILLFGFTGLLFQLQAQDNHAPSPLIFIYDASGSMWGQIERKTKMEIASSVLSTSIKELPENQQIGLVAYGHRNKSDGRDVSGLEASHTIENVSVGAGEVAEVAHNFNTGVAFIGAKEGDTLIDCSVGI